jgi:hypothetical protein
VVTFLSRTDRYSVFTGRSLVGDRYTPPFRPEFIEHEDNFCSVGNHGSGVSAGRQINSKGLLRVFLPPTRMPSNTNNTLRIENDSSLAKECIILVYLACIRFGKVQTRPR